MLGCAASWNQTNVVSKDNTVNGTNVFYINQKKLTTQTRILQWETSKFDNLGTLVFYNQGNLEQMRTLDSKVQGPYTLYIQAGTII